MTVAREGAEEGPPPARPPAAGGVGSGGGSSGSGSGSGSDTRRRVLFDFGAVVFHWEPLRLLSETLPAHAPDAAAAAALAESIFEGFRIGSDWSEFDLGRIDADALAARIAARTGFLGAAEVRAVIDAVPPALLPDPPTLALLRRLKAAGHRLHFLSNMPAPYVLHLEREHDFFHLFDAGVYSSRLGLIKPDPAFYARAAAELGFDPGVRPPPVFIDDVQANVDAARVLGWDAFVYRDAAQCEAELVGRGLLP